MWRFLLPILFLILIFVFLFKPEMVIEPINRINEFLNPGPSYSCSFATKYGYGCEVLLWDQSTGTATIRITQKRYTSTYIDYAYCESYVSQLHLTEYPPNGTYVKTRLGPEDSVEFNVKCLDYKGGSYKGHLIIWYFEEIANENRLADGEITIYPELG